MLFAFLRVIKVLDLLFDLLELLLAHKSAQLLLGPVILRLSKIDIRVVFVNLIVHFQRLDLGHLEDHQFGHIECERIFKLRRRNRKLSLSRIK